MGAAVVPTASSGMGAFVAVYVIVILLGLAIYGTGWSHSWRDIWTASAMFVKLRCTSAVSLSAGATS